MEQKTVFLQLIFLLIVVVFISSCIQQTSNTEEEQKQPLELLPTEIKQSIPIDFPLEYINKSREYLISKFGKNLFESSIQFEAAYIDEFDYGGGCTVVIEPIERGKKYVVAYKLNLDKYVNFPQESYFNNSGLIPMNIADNGYIVKVIYNHLGKIYCTDQVVDCVNFPEYCSPFKINDYKSAIDIFSKACNRTFTRINFEIYTNYNLLGYLEANETRFLWYFDDTRCGRHCGNSWAVYIDPQTGKPTHDDYFANGNYYCDKNETCEYFLNFTEEGGFTTIKELGLDFRVCKESS